MFVLLVTLALLQGFCFASQLRWVGDDIFITLRYVANFVGGHGLVYNPGERVEGYSHFLWLMVIALFQRLRCDPVQAALDLGLLSYLGTLALLGFVSRRLATRDTWLPLPFASLALAVHFEAATWATGGLETAFFSLLLVAGFTVYFISDLPRTWKLPIAGTIVALAVLTRPDASLLMGLSMALLAARAIALRVTWRAAVMEIVGFCAPITLILVPYVAWKLSYYGDLVPNTYYAKSAGQSYYSQGFFYLWTYARCYPTTWLALLALPAAALSWRSARGARAVGGRRWIGAALERDHLGAMLFALTIATVYLVGFVARVGGDFMYGRFVVPMLPFLYLLVEWSFPRLNRRFSTAAPFALLLIVLAIPTIERGNRDRYLVDVRDGRSTVRDHRGIIDERCYYTAGVPIAEQRHKGEALAPYFAGLHATVLSRGQACFAYYAGFQTCIDNTGLTDARIARQPLAQRGRIGHEKSASYDYLIERGTDFVFRRPLYRDKQYRVALFSAPGEGVDRAEIITYDPALLRELKHRMGDNFSYAPFEPLLDEYIRTELPVRPIETLRADYQEFRDYYFRHNADPERERPFLARLASSAAAAR